MKKSFKKMLCGMLSLAMIAGSIVLPVTASAAGETPLVTGDTVIKEWKLSFGTGDAPSGYTHVPKTAHAVLGDTGAGEDKGYGFIGTHADDFNFSERHDGLKMVQGYVTNLKETANGIGSTGTKNSTSGFEYPVRFALNCADGDYFRVKMELTNLDSGKDATDVTVWSERKHYLISHETIAEDETKTLEFSVDVEPQYFEKSDPKGKIADGQLNIVVGGENVAVKSMIIQQVNPGVTLWILGDSTVTDGNSSMPYFELNNYTGVGSGTTKYLRSDYAMSNQGEGGLAAGDSYHFNMAKERLKAGDYMWVEYGHNHKNDGVAGYIKSIDKYYQACKAPAKGGSANGGKATLVLVGPIDRHNSYTASTNTWNTSLAQYSRAAKAYADLMTNQGETSAATFVSKYSSNDDAVVAAAYEYYETEMAKTKSSSAVTNVAFVDLNQPSLDWFATKTAKGTVAGTEYTNDERLINFYFQTSKGGKTDGTHPNDAGAEGIVEYFFRDAPAKIAAYPALTGLLSKADGTVPAASETPTGRHSSPIAQSVLDGGWAGASTNSAWPDALSAYDYPTRIKKINFDEDGKLVSADVNVQDNSIMPSYGRGLIAVYNKTTGVLEGTAISNANADSVAAGLVGWVDNSTGVGVQTLAFDGSTLTYNPETQNMKAFLWSMEDNEKAGYPLTFMPYANDNTGGDGQFVPLEFEYILTNDSLTGPEQFHYYGIKADTTIATGQNGWTISGVTLTTKSEKVEDEDTWYGAISGSGSMTKSLTSSISDGILEVSGKIRKSTGTTAVQLANGSDTYTIMTVEDTAVKNSAGTAVEGVTLGDEWTAFTYTLDLNKSQGTLSVGSAEGTAADASAYKKLLIKDIKPLPVTALKLAMTGAAIDITDLTVKNVTRTDDLAKVAMTADFTTGSDSTMGTLTVTPASAQLGSAVTYKAANKAGYKFAGWYTDEAGTTLLAAGKTLTVKAIGATTIYAKYEVNDGIYFEDDFETAEDFGKELKQGTTHETLALENFTLDMGGRDTGGKATVYGKIASGNGLSGTTTHYLECGIGDVSGSKRGVTFTFNYPIPLSDTDAAKDIAWEFDTAMYTTAADGISSSVNFLEGIGRVTPSSVVGLNTETWRKAQIVFDKTGNKEYLVIRDAAGKVLSVTTLADNIDASKISIDGADFYGTESYPPVTICRFDNMKIYDIGTNGTTAEVPHTVTVTAPAGAKVTVGATELDMPSTGTVDILLCNGAVDVTATCAGYENYSETLTVSGNTLTVDMTQKTTATTSVTVNFLDGTTPIKTAETISKTASGADLYVTDPFALDNSYKRTLMIPDSETGLYDTYVFDATNSDSLSIASLASTNTINLKYTKLADQYAYYEDFENIAMEDLTDATTGILKGDTASMSIIDNDATYGSYLQLKHASNAQSINMTMPDLDMLANKSYVFEMDLGLALGNAADQSSGFAIKAKDTELSGYSASDKYLFKMAVPASVQHYNNTDYQDVWNINDSTTDTFKLYQRGPGGYRWAHLKLEVNAQTKAVTATISQTESADSSKTFTYTSTSADAIVKGFVNYQSKSWPNSVFDNIKVYVPIVE